MSSFKLTQCWAINNLVGPLTDNCQSHEHFSLHLRSFFSETHLPVVQIDPPSVAVMCTPTWADFHVENQSESRLCLLTHLFQVIFPIIKH